LCFKDLRNRDSTLVIVQGAEDVSPVQYVFSFIKFVIKRFSIASFLRD